MTGVRLLRAFRALPRSNEIALVLVAALVGVGAAICVTAVTQAANAMHVIIYQLPFDVRLSASDRVSIWVAMPTLALGGLSLGLYEVWRLARKLPSPVDPIEANALRGGRMSLRDSVVVAVQTTISNGCGASVGLEAAYAQIGAGLGSFFGQSLRLRRADLRLLVGAGAAAAIGGSFGAPLCGAFYAFEIILGSYSIAAAGPVFTASIVGTLVTRALEGAPYQISTPATDALTFHYYPVLFLVAALAAAFGIAVMRIAGLSEVALRASRMPSWARPMAGGLLVATLASFTPQILGAGHGALALDVASAVPLAVVAALLGLKATACMVSLASGFRGGLFFASLLMGALLGKACALALAAASPALAFDQTILVLAGMATVGVVIVGGPLTMSFLVLENTGDFSVTGGVLAASIAASLIARAAFGYSFSTWRLHLRGQNIRSANDIGWIADLTVGRLMQANPPVAQETETLGRIREDSLQNGGQIIVLTDASGRYAGIVNLSELQGSTPDISASTLAKWSGASLTADMNAKTAMAAFDGTGAEQLAVVDGEGAPIGLLSESHLARRYAEKADAAARGALGL